MDRLANSLMNLEKVQEDLSHYSHEIHPVLQTCPERHAVEADELAVLYELLVSLNQVMTKELDSITLHLHALNHPSYHNGKPETLSMREREVLLLLAKGYSYNDVAALIGCTRTTTQTYVKRIYKKLKVHSKSEAVFEALSLGLIHLNN